MDHSLWKFYSTIINGIKSNKSNVIHPCKKICVDVLKVMYKEGYINGYRKHPIQKDKVQVFLKYTNGKPSLAKLSVVSKPSNRIYMSLKILCKLKTSFVTFVLSTHKGIMSDKECRKLKLGGELLCVIF